MRRYLLAFACLAALAAPPARAAAGLTAAQIADRNVKARGGLEAWRAVRTLKLSGELDAGGKTEARLPFALYLRRPHQSRLEIAFAGKNAVQVYDGTRGWKLRPYLNRDDVEPYKPAELASAAAESELDGPLVDWAAKGTRLELVGTEKVAGKKAYKLALTRGGQRRLLWVDATTFLDVKASGDPRTLDGRPHPVSIYSRDWRTVDGLKIPFVQETVVEGVKGAAKGHKMVLKAVAVNPPLADPLFAKPAMAMAKAPGR